MKTLTCFLSMIIFLMISVHFTQAQCDFVKGMKDNPSVRCGKITVPEDHQNPSGRKIDLAYAILKAKNPKAGKHPIIYFEGGPGAKNLFKPYMMYWMQNPMRNEHDVILIDQRGLGHSSKLPNMGTEAFAICAKNINEAEELTLTRKLVKKYQAICIKKGIGLQYYNTAQNARDVGKLMKHLRYSKYNLYGASYGTRVARQVADLYPGYVHTVVMSAPAPMLGSFLKGRLESYSKSLDRILKYCENDPDTKIKYPNLRQNYLEAIKQIRKQPIKVTFQKKPFFVNAQDVTLLMRRVMYHNKSLKLVPRLIDAFKNKKEQPIIEAITQEFYLNQFLNITMLLSVEKYENFDLNYTDRKIAKTYKKLPLLPVRLAFFDPLFRSGQNWHQGELPLKQRKFKMSAIPTLIIVNQYDPVTPPLYGHWFMKHLSKGTLIVLDEGGHGGGNPACLNKVRIAFMDNPTGKIDTSCMRLYKGK